VSRERPGFHAESPSGRRDTGLAICLLSAGPLIAPFVSHRMARRESGPGVAAAATGH
jgi:hypothetical protein